MRGIINGGITSLLKVFGLNRRKISASGQVVIYLGLTMTGINMINSLHDYRSYNGIDLRARIVGTRAMLKGINPYTLDYSPKLPETLQDPSQSAQGLSRCPYPPSVLLFYAPLSFLPYPVIRAISIVLEWIALLATIAVLARTLKSHQLRVIFVIIALSAFSGSYFWRLHVERGQYHVFVTLLMSLGVYQVLVKRKDSWIGGVPFGLALSMRPTVAVVLLIISLAKFPKTAISAIGTAIIVVLLTLPFGGLRFWQDWRILVNRYENIIAGIKDNSREIAQRLPVEGYHPRRTLKSKTDNSSALSITIYILKATKIHLEPEKIKILAKAGLAIISITFLGVFFWGAYKKRYGIRFTLYGAILLALITEFIAPIRFGYADVQLILLVPLALPLFLRPRARFLGSIVILSFLVGGYLPFIKSENSDQLRSIIFIIPNLLIVSNSAITRSRNKLLLEQS